MASIPLSPGQTLLFSFTFLFCSLGTSLAEPLTASSYSQHCGAIAPESAPTKLLFGASNSFRISDGFFTGGGRLNNFLFPSPSTDIPTFYTNTPRAFYFKPTQVHLTHDKGILKLEGTLVLRGAVVLKNSTTHSRRREYERRRVIFKFSGFWSEDTGKLCMEGTGEPQPSKEDHIADARSAVLKLEYPKMSNITTSVIEGTITSTSALDTSPAYFEPISLQAYEQKNYKYTIMEHAEKSCSQLPEAEGSIAIEGESLCANFENLVRGMSFSSRGLLPFLGSRSISIRQLKCSSDGKMHLSIALTNESMYFYYGTPLVPGKSLVAEGAWDHQRNRLCILACKLTGGENHSSARPKVGDCNLGLVIWFPSTFSLKKRSTMTGSIWNTSDESDNNGNRKVVPLYSPINDLYLVVPGSKYEYTQLDTARKHCKVRNPNQKIKEMYADATSYMDMSFQLTVRHTNGRSSWGDAQQVSVDETYHGNPYGSFFRSDNMYTTETHTTTSSSLQSTDQNRTIWSVGYAISYTFWNDNFTESVKISAEGIYNARTGTLCLVGCRLPTFERMRNGTIVEESSSMIDEEKLDCEIFIELQLPPLDANNVKGKGAIKSTRAKLDPLYFNPLEVELSLMYGSQSTETFGRMNAEMVMVIISLTLLCGCTYMQLHHARKHSEIVPMMSTTMLVVLTVGSMVSLVSNIEAMLLPAKNRQTLLQSGGWLDATNTIVRLIAMVTLLIQVRLLQLAWGSRSKDENPKDVLFVAEKKSLMLCVPLYFFGALVTWFVHSHSSQLDHAPMEDLSRYVGLMVDNFLLPQIVFNIFSQSKDKVLTPVFYIGATLVRAVPHIYNAYRSWRYAINFKWSDIYANHSEDYYSGLLDVLIPVEGLVFVLLVYLQQRFGGRCFLPKRFKRDAGYELVSVSST